MKAHETPHTSTTNACKLCKPLGACLAFRGIEGAVPFLHGSQGCASSMRRYVISHFREPMGIASSSLGEKHAIHGGGPNLKQGLKNVMDKYGAGLIGVASTCLTETIGDDMPGLVQEFRRELHEAESPEIVTVSTPSYRGAHSKGYHLAKRRQVPLVRVGFPIHDRFGGPRILHLGYRGAQNLLDQIVNAMIERKQETSPVGFGYM